MCATIERSRTRRPPRGSQGPHPQVTRNPSTGGGVLGIHLRTGRVMLGSSPDATAMLNHLRTQLTLWSHPNGALQADGDGDGADGFAFDVVDVVPPSDEPDRNIADDLQTLVALWEDQLSLLPEDRC